MQKEDCFMPNKSAEIFNSSLSYLAGGSSTGSKRPQFMPEEPGVIVRGKGCRVWDADGREFIDFRNGLGPVTLGYCMPEINAAISEQLANGIVFSQPHPLEGRVAKLLCENIPCAERVRFLKTGGESCAATLRLARAFTGRNKVMQIGYNGWLNSVGSGALALPGRPALTKAPPGVPTAVSELFTICRWNDIEMIESILAAHPEDYAAIIIACDYPTMDQGKTFLPAVRSLTKRYGVLMIMDEIVTGFRLAMGGAHEYFKFKPDLAVFAKGMANGMPISTFVGSAEVMKTLDECIVSSTYGGETLSLAAAEAVINFYKKHDVCAHIWRGGEMLWSGLQKLFDAHGIGITVKGLWPCPRFLSDDATLIPKFMRAAYANGIALYNVSYVNYSHKDSDLTEALERLEKAVKSM
jgi:glutamate-1-semialdehyde 2,1-aminomutase